MLKVLLLLYEIIVQAGPCSYGATKKSLNKTRVHATIGDKIAKEKPVFQCPVSVKFVSHNTRMNNVWLIAQLEHERALNERAMSETRSPQRYSNIIHLSEYMTYASNTCTCYNALVLLV